MQSFENHSPDFNVDLMYLHNKYGEMLNQVTQLETISRPFTANSNRSAFSRKHSPNEVVMEKMGLPKINVLPEPKFKYIDSNPKQSGSSWNVPQILKKSYIGSNADSEQNARFEKIRIEHHNARQK